MGRLGPGRRVRDGEARVKWEPKPRPLVPLAWLTVSGGTGVVPTSSPWTYSPQLNITFTEASVLAGPA
jgi:hypothetical protein